MQSTNSTTSRAFVTQLLNSLSNLPPSTPPVGASSAAPSNFLNSVPDATKKQLLTLHVLFPNEFLPALDLLDRRLITRFRIRREPVVIAAPQHEDVVESAIVAPRNPQVQNEDAGPTEDDGVSRAISLPPISEHRPTGHTNPSESEGFRSSYVEMQDSEEVTHLPHTPEPPIPNDQDVERPTAQHDSDKDTVHHVRSAQQRSSRYSTSYDSTVSYEVRLKAWNCSCPAFAFSAFPSIHPEPCLAEFGDEDVLRQNRSAEFNLGKMEHEKAVRTFGGLSLGDAMPPVCKHLLACVLVERCTMFGSFVEEKDVSVEEAAGWAAGWGD